MTHLLSSSPPKSCQVSDDQSQSDPLISREDRSFDTIADHFEKKVYGGLKGAIRLAVLRRDIHRHIDQLSHQLGRTLRILDVGAGLAQLSIELASCGHDVVINDISPKMLAKARAAADHQKTTLIKQMSAQHPLTSNEITNRLSALANIQWLDCPYQQLESKLKAQSASQFDLILCHALLEWLAQPEAIMDFFDRWLASHGILSLCFYNPASFDYRNLIMGNFNLLNNQNYQADNKKSLTPNHPVPKEVVEDWLTSHDYQTLEVSGLRVFHDYAPLKRGGHNDPEAVIQMELRYSDKSPYKWLGRYLHYLITPMRRSSSYNPTTPLIRK